MSVIDFKNSKMYYIVFREYSVPVRMEYNLFSFDEAKDKALSYCATSVNRKASVFSISEKNPSPKEEFVVSNQFIETVYQEKAS